MRAAGEWRRLCGVRPQSPLVLVIGDGGIALSGGAAEGSRGRPVRTVVCRRIITTRRAVPRRQALGRAAARVAIWVRDA